MTTATTELFDLDDILDDAITANNPPEVADAAAAETPEKTSRRRATCPANVLFFDLETVPDYSREPHFDLPAIPAPAVYAGENDGPAPTELIAGTEDDVKARIAKAQSGGKMLPRVILDAAIKMESKEKKPRKGVIGIFQTMISAIDNEAAIIQAAVDANRKTMSVTPEFCRIVAFGWALGDDGSQASVFGEKGGTKCHDTFEGAVLKKFWDLAMRAKCLIGFNHVGFDLPVIYARSALLGIEPTKMIDLKPWGGEVVDLMATRWPRGGAKKLKELAKIVGLPIPAGDVDGSQVEALLKADPFKVGEYCRSDVSITREIYLMYRGMYWA